ncbi:MAG: hypothetical protein O7A65_06210, partial [Proteobacteria bacterium]|nr:hypothetical protein [Pseudomonadota bacterium]
MTDGQQKDRPGWSRQREPVAFFRRLRVREGDMRLNGALAALAFGLMSGVALAEQDYVVPEGVTLMTEDEIRSKIIGNTLGGSE